MTAERNALLRIRAACLAGLAAGEAVVEGTDAPAEKVLQLLRAIIAECERGLECSSSSQPA